MAADKFLTGENVLERTLGEALGTHFHESVGDDS